METLLIGPLVILGLQLTWVSGQTKPKQTPPSLNIREGESPTLYCNDFEKTIRSLQWYRQDYGKSPVFLFLLALKNDVKRDRRLTATIDKGNQTSSLHIRDAKPGDSATYLCAVETQ
uniref:Ig-like domain-containing protein n=1 Tax=Ornithorhynchus anatinus TaxID=9258 RepID=A0A6I8NVC9_ORNAN